MALVSLIVIFKKRGVGMSEREEQLEKYRKMDVISLLKIRFYDSYEPSTLEQIIFEKVKALQSICSDSLT